MECKYCQSTKVMKRGIANHKQKYLCRDCGRKLSEGSGFTWMRTESHAVSLKDRMKPMRWSKDEETVGILLEGWAVHHNYVRKHQTIKMTPAQASGINLKNDWHLSAKEATKYHSLDRNEQNAIPIEVR